MSCERLRNVERDLADIDSVHSARQIVEGMEELSCLDDVPPAGLGKEERIAHYEALAHFILETTEPQSKDRRALLYHFLIQQRFETEAAVTILMSSALIEAMINSALLFQLAEDGRSSMFNLVDKWSVVEKWVHGPAVVMPSYVFPRDTVLYQRLDELTKARNAAAHNKGMLVIDGVRHHPGKSMYPSNGDRRLRWLKQVANLPYHLRDFLKDQLGLIMMPIVMVNSSRPNTDVPDLYSSR